MGLKVETRIQGQHSTDVDVAFFTRLVEESLMKDELEGSIQMQIRCVHINRRSRPPGVYPVAYDVYVPHSIEVLLFGSEATGRPATLLARTDEKVGQILQTLSPRLFQTWQQGNSRNYRMGTTFIDISPKKVIRRGRTRGSAADMLKGALSTLRSNLKHEGALRAYQLVTAAGNQSILAQDIILEIFACESAGAILLQPVLHLIEQMGYIEPMHSDEVAEANVKSWRLTEFCYDLAQFWVNEENCSRQTQFQVQQQRSAQTVDRARARLIELESQVEAQKAKLQGFECQLEALNETPLQLIPSVI